MEEPTTTFRVHLSPEASWSLEALMRHHSIDHLEIIKRSIVLRTACLWKMKEGSHLKARKGSETPIEIDVFNPEKGAIFPESTYRRRKQSIDVSMPEKLIAAIRAPHDNPASSVVEETVNDGLVLLYQVTSRHIFGETIFFQGSAGTMQVLQLFDVETQKI